VSNQNTVQFLRVFECKHCKQHFVIVKAKNTFIPVNAKPDAQYAPNTEYDHNTMRTHLKDCSERKKDWQQVVKVYLAFHERRFVEVPVYEPNASDKPLDEAGEVQKKKHRDNAVLPGTQEYERIKAEFNQQLKKDEQ
jgi:hypothetical protein